MRTIETRGTWAYTQVGLYVAVYGMSIQLVYSIKDFKINRIHLTRFPRKYNDNNT